MDTMTNAPSISSKSCPGTTRKVAELFEELNRQNIEYCHWKSNNCLPEALRGYGDLDLLVSREDMQRFDAVLAALRFRVATTPRLGGPSAVCHFFGFDELTGHLIHVHVYYRLITGGSFLKNYRLPLENLLIRDSRLCENVRTPSKAAELLTLVLRKVIEAGSLIEHAFLRREYANIHSELTWLDESGVTADAVELCRRWLPCVDVRDFERGVQALRLRKDPIRLMWLSMCLRRRLKMYSILPSGRRRVWETVAFMRFVIGRLHRTMESKRPLAGGVIVAFVGPDASGKSTLLLETSRWIGKHFATETWHVGKPPPTFITFVPRLFLPLMRWCFRRARTNVIDADVVESSDQSAVRRQRSVLYLIRCVIIAIDRWAVMRRCYRKANMGVIILCDRYPSVFQGGSDGPRVEPAWFGRHQPLRRWLAGMERKLYVGLPKPDVIFRLTVPVDVAEERNATRQKVGPRSPATEVRSRHARFDKWGVRGVRVVDIDTTGSLKDCILEVKREVWKSL